MNVLFKLVICSLSYLLRKTNFHLSIITVNFWPTRVTCFEVIEYSKNKSNTFKVRGLPRTEDAHFRKYQNPVYQIYKDWD